MEKDQIILHWSAGYWEPSYLEMCHYHAGVSYDPIKGKAEGQKWNNYFVDLPEQCWKRNDRSIGLCVCAMISANEWNFGKQPLRPEQVKELCMLAAEVAYIKKIQVKNILTHAEAAIEDNYFGERWDLARLTPGKITPAGAVETGNILRAEIKQYKQELMDGKRTIRPFHLIGYSCGVKE